VCHYGIDTKNIVIENDGHCASAMKVLVRQYE
jgi:hypothetical protein